MQRYNTSPKIETARSKYKVHCKHCSHVLVFTPANKKKKILCNVCGYYVYRNDKEEFKDRLLKKQKEEEKWQ